MGVGAAKLSFAPWMVATTHHHSPVFATLPHYASQQHREQLSPAIIRKPKIAQISATVEKYHHLFIPNIAPPAIKKELENRMNIMSHDEKLNAYIQETYANPLMESIDALLENSSEAVLANEVVSGNVGTPGFQTVQDTLRCVCTHCGHDGFTLTNEKTFSEKIREAVHVSFVVFSVGVVIFHELVGRGLPVLADAIMMLFQRFIGSMVK